MTGEYYRFELGGFECVALSDGGKSYKPGRLFPSVPKRQIEDALRKRNLPTDHIWTPYTYLLVDTGEHRVLVDMGAPKTPSTGRLRQSIRAASIDVAEIDTVIITHAHPDHVGGTLDDEGKLNYPNAHYYVWKGEWDFWTSETAASKAPERHVALARRTFRPLRERVELLDHEDEIVPGIRAVPAPGHTPGHMVVSVASGDHQLLYISDTVVSPLHLEHPDWTGPDISPDEAAASKRRIFDRAVEEKALVLGMHFPPFPSLGHVVKKGEGWKWQPIEATGEMSS